MRCVVLAGGINRRKLYQGYEPGFKALVEIGGRPLLSYVLEALGQARGVGEVTVVGDRQALQGVGGPSLRFLPPGSTLVDSLKSALGAYPGEERVLICTADLPLLRAPMVEEFLAACREGRAGYRDQLFLSVVPADRFVGVFASCKKNLNRFRDLTLCHGNLAVASPGILDNPAALARIDGIYAARTSPIRSALAVGPALGLAYVLGVHILPLLRLDQFAALLSRRFSIGMTAVVANFPEMAIDIDEPADYDIATEVLK